MALEINKKDKSIKIYAEDENQLKLFEKILEEEFMNQYAKISKRIIEESNIEELTRFVSEVKDTFFSKNKQITFVLEESKTNEN